MDLQVDAAAARAYKRVYLRDHQGIELRLLSKFGNHMVVEDGSGYEQEEPDSMSPGAA